MTTIAFDGKSIAADGLIICGNEISSFNEKKIWTDALGYKAIAISGNWQKVDMFIRFVKGHNVSKIDLKGNYIVMMITNDNKIITIDMDVGYDFKFNVGMSQYAIGSGGEYALGAMIAGASAKKAVECAESVDITTGGEIVSHQLFY